MLSRQDVTLALKQFAAEQGLPELVLDDHDSAVVEFGEELAVIFEFSEPDGSFTLWSPLCSLGIAESLVDEHKLLKVLMTLNFPASRLKGSHLAIDTELGMVLLARPVALDPAELGRLGTLAQNHAQVVEELIGRLKDGSLLADDADLRLSGSDQRTASIRV